MWPEGTEEDNVPINAVEAVGKQPTVNRGVWEETGLSPRSKPLNIPPELQSMKEKEAEALLFSPHLKQKEKDTKGLSLR